MSSGTIRRFAWAGLGLGLAGCAAHESERVVPEPASTSQSAARGATSKERSKPRVTPARAASRSPVVASPVAPASVKSEKASQKAVSDEATPELLVSAQPSWHEPWKECVGLRVHIVSLSPGDPEDSAASISTTANGRAHIVHPGQWIGEWEVLAITDDWTGMKPGVWLRRDAEVCRALLSGSHEHAQPPPSSNKRAKKRRAR